MATLSSDSPVTDSPYEQYQVPSGDFSTPTSEGGYTDLISYTNYLNNLLANDPNISDSGDVQGSTTQTDPYSQWGGQENYNNLVSGYDTQIGSVYDTAGETATTKGGQINRGILSFLDQLRLGQAGIDNQAVNNELALRQGRQGVSGMVGRGIRSGGVLLANKNAGDSSAAQAIARAYGDVGRRQLSSIGNQYALQNRNISQAQDAFNVNRTGKVRDFKGSKTDLINGIVSDARSSLASIDAEMSGLSLPDKINAEQDKEKVRQDALEKLAYLDSKLGQADDILPTSLEQRRSAALGLSNAGEAATDAFSFTDQVPAQFQGAGLPSSLPLFSAPRSRRQS